MSECKGQKKAAESVRKYDSIIRWQLSNLKNQMVKGQPLFVQAHLDSCLNCSGLVAAISPYSGYRKLSTCGYWWRYRRSSSSCSLFTGGFRLPFTNAITASKLDLRAMDSLCNKLVKQSKDWVFSH
jgi:hypothetical protein